MAERKELNSLHTQLSAEYKKGFSDVKKCAEILEKLKVHFVPYNRFPHPLLELLFLDWPYTNRLFTVCRYTARES